MEAFPNFTEVLETALLDVGDVSGIQNTTAGKESSQFSQPLTVVYLLRDFPNIFLVTLGAVIAAVSLFCNGVVLHCLLKVSDKALRSKLLIINALVIDILLPLSYSVVTVYHVAAVFGLPDAFMLCLGGMKAIFEPTFHYAQSFASVVLVGDRLYAVVAPLRYHMKAYSKYASICLVAVTWLVSFILTGPIFFNLSTQRTTPGVCFNIAQNHYAWTNRIRFPVVICISACVFVTYTFLFVYITYKKKTVRSISNARAVKMKETISLSVTYFIVHFSAVCLFVPGPLFAVLMQRGMVKLDFATMWMIRRAGILMYISNSMIDPVIMATRIPALRRQIVCLWGQETQSEKDCSTSGLSSQSRNEETRSERF